MPYWKRANHYSIVNSLEGLITNAGYHTLLVSLDLSNPSLDVIIERSLDAVFLINVKDDMFYSISSKFVEGIPLIVIDSLIEDKLFKQVTYDYQSALQLAASTIQTPYCLIMESYNNNSLVSYIQKSLNIAVEAIFTVNTLPDLKTLLKQNMYEHAIVINEFIGNHVEKLNHFTSLTVICTCSCPEILSNKTRKITFQEDKSSVSFRKMEDILKNVAYNTQNENKYFLKVNN